MKETMESLLLVYGLPPRNELVYVDTRGDKPAPTILGRARAMGICKDVELDAERGRAELAHNEGAARETIYH